MEIIKKTSIHYLTDKSVDVSIEQFVEIDGKEIKLDIPKTLIPYLNSLKGREQLQSANYPRKIINAVMMVWGDIPNTEDPIEEVEQLNILEHE